MKLTVYSEDGATDVPMKSDGEGGYVNAERVTLQPDDMLAINGQPVLLNTTGIPGIYQCTARWYSA